MSRTQQGSSPWYQLDGATEEVRMSSYHILSNVENIMTSNPSVVIEIMRKRVLFADVGFLVQQELAQFNVMGFVFGTPTPDFNVRIFNITDAVLLATLNFTETTPTPKSVAFSLPSATKICALEIFRNSTSGGGSLFLDHVNMTWLVSP